MGYALRGLIAAEKSSTGQKAGLVMFTLWLLLMRARVVSLHFALKRKLGRARQARKRRGIKSQFNSKTVMKLVWIVEAFADEKSGEWN